MRSSDSTTTIYSGAGNTFTFVSPIQDHNLDQDEIKAICKIKSTDGLIYLNISAHQRADFFMYFFNNDGSMPGLCGNGLRCIKAYLADQGYNNLSYKIETPSGIYTLQDEAHDKISVSYPQPSVIKKINFSGLEAHLIDVGILHLVVPLKSIKLLDVNTLGRSLRFSKELSPQGANINFFSASEKDAFYHIRTYERGVEEETMACGSGALAVAYFIHLQKNKLQTITMKTRSGELLHHLVVLKDPSNFQNIDYVKQTGPAKRLL